MSETVVTVVVRAHKSGAISQDVCMVYHAPFHRFAAFTTSYCYCGSYVYAILLDPACMHPCAAARQNLYGYGMYHSASTE